MIKDAATSQHLHNAHDGLRVPRITIEAFCETLELSAMINAAAADRRMSRATVRVNEGGISAATEFYKESVTPELVLVESGASDLLLRDLSGLAAVCDARTKVVVVGVRNDINLYRALSELGISEYLVAPVDTLSIIAVIARLFSGAERFGKIYAFVGAKGGVGSSTIAHNVAWSLAKVYNSEVVLADLDLPFGTVGSDFNLDALQGIGEAIQDPQRLDDLLFDRLLAKREDHLSLLTAPLALDRFEELGENAFDHLLEIGQSAAPFLVLDVPHVWNSWTKRTLISADEVVITAAPDLISFRNANNLLRFLQQQRPNDVAPKIVLNQIGVPKRPEIRPKEFAAALQLEPIANIRFDPQSFGTASNEGRMVAAKGSWGPTFIELTRTLTGREPVRTRSSGLHALLSKFTVGRKPATA